MKKYTSGEFVATKYGIYNAAQDTITSFPSTIIANGANASAIIKGNMQQAGTPTPAAPIYPTECGDLSSGNYVIPVVSGGVTTNIDLSAVQSARNIKKLVLTGQEGGWVKNSIITSGNGFYNPGLYTGYKTNVEGICSHYQTITTISAIEGIYWGANINIITNYNDGIDDTDKWKNFLATQYTNGTPVTLWYVLATETTATLNEPLRKIGDYADSVAASAIPTTPGSQTFNIDTTLKPSEVDLTYTGWHMYDDKKYSGGWG